MDPILRNVLSVFVGIIVGWLVNGGIIVLSIDMVTPPAGVDPTDIESIKANLHLYEFKHFFFPFLAHALGTLAGAFVAVKVAATHKIKFAYAIAGFFMVGGIMMAYMLKGPIWFIVTDLSIAYIPMAYLGARLGKA